MTSTKKKKKLPSISDPKSPAAAKGGQRTKKMPAFPKSGTTSVGQRVRKLPSLCDPKSY